MKILIVADLHANLEAVEALPKDFDRLWVLGDLVNYGPDPKEVVDFVRENASVVIRGNHDHAIGFDEDPRCSAPFRRMAEETRRYTRSVLGEEHRKYLRGLPLMATAAADGRRVLFCHATPSDPLFAYRPQDSDLWLTDEVDRAIHVELVGHTHVPFRRALPERLIVNPGSVGQPKHGFPMACYALWEDGRIFLRSCHYPVEDTVRKVYALPVPLEIRSQLAAVLLSGSPPPGRSGRLAL